MLRKTLIPLFAFVSIMSPLLVFAQSLPVIELTVGMHRIKAEVAYKQADQTVGLMGRKTMAPQNGMLFVFDVPAKQCMWMRNTLLPLSVAFLDDQGHIINVEEMQPETDDYHCAAKNAKYALEMNGGWFRSRGLGSGAQFFGIEKATPAR